MRMHAEPASAGGRSGGRSQGSRGGAAARRRGGSRKAGKTEPFSLHPPQVSLPFPRVLSGHREYQSLSAARVRRCVRERFWPQLCYRGKAWHSFRDVIRSRYNFTMAGNMGEPENERADLYIALVCAAGTDLTETKNQLKAQLSVVGYRYEEIKVSSLIAELMELDPPKDEYSRMKTLMSAGDCIREASENGQGVAAAIIAEIRRKRGDNVVPSTTAFVIDSLKNPSEVDLLDTVYGRNYYTVSVFLPRDERIINLRNKIAKGRREPPEDRHSGLAEALVTEDERGIGRKSQDVRSTFPRADYFVNGAGDVSRQIKRFVELVFQEPFTTPTPDEYYMFVAKASALRSCDLSRQVGAVIVDDRQSIISTGCNEVPYPGGGIYFEGRINAVEDNRDFTKGSDPNYIEIQRTLIEFIGVLIESDHLKTDKQPSELADALLHGQYKNLMTNARIRNLIEFGRVVHAEMHALSQAAALGRPVQGATIYCTTFPCHGCARHIIASGISEVVYIEPYPKSLTAQLYESEIVLSHDRGADQAAPDLVRFRPFHGIAPQLYNRVFSYRDRKDQYGTIAIWNPRTATPVGAILGVERPSVETAASNAVASILEQARVAFATDRGE